MRDKSYDEWMRDTLGIDLDAAAPAGDSSAGDEEAAETAAADPAVQTLPPPGVRDDPPLPPPGVLDELPRQMQLDCKLKPNHVAGPKNHVLCGTHGHVIDTTDGMIRWNSVAEYDAAFPLGRPKEADCAPDPGKLPYAPKNIVVCKTHGHVLDLSKGTIEGNTRTMYLRAHPQYAAPKGGGGGAGKLAASGSFSPPDAKELSDISLDLQIYTSGKWNFSLQYTYTGTAPRVFKEILFLAKEDGNPWVSKCEAHEIQPGEAWQGMEIPPELPPGTVGSEQNWLINLKINSDDGEVSLDFASKFLTHK
jgi:hypothetical protein